MDIKAKCAPLARLAADQFMGPSRRHARFSLVSARPARETLAEFDLWRIQRDDSFTGVAVLIQRLTRTIAYAFAAQS